MICKTNAPWGGKRYIYKYYRSMYPRDGHSCAAAGDEVILIGGDTDNSVEAVNIVTGEKRLITSSSGAKDQSSAIVIGDEVVVNGGRSSNNVEAININTGIVRELPSLSDKKYQVNICKYGEEVIFAGGTSDLTFTSSEIEAINVNTNTKRALVSLDERRYACGFGLIGDEMVFAGGFGAGFLDSVEVINIKQNTKRTLPSLSQKGTAISVVYKDKLYVVSTLAYGSDRTLESVDPSTNKVEKLMDIPNYLLGYNHIGITANSMLIANISRRKAYYINLDTLEIRPAQDLYYNRSTAVMVNMERGVAIACGREPNYRPSDFIDYYEIKERGN